MKVSLHPTLPGTACADEDTGVKVAAPPTEPRSPQPPPLEGPPKVSPRTLQEDEPPDSGRPSRPPLSAKELGIELRRLEYRIQTFVAEETRAILALVGAPPLLKMTVPPRGDGVHAAASPSAPQVFHGLRRSELSSMGAWVSIPEGPLADEVLAPEASAAGRRPSILPDGEAHGRKSGWRASVVQQLTVQLARSNPQPELHSARGVARWVAQHRRFWGGARQHKHFSLFL